MKRLTFAAMVLMGAAAMAISGCQNYSADEEVAKETTMTQQEKTDATIRHAAKNADKNATTAAQQANQKTQ